MIDSFRGPFKWLSNFELVTIPYEGITYPSTEHAYQASKTLNWDLRRAMAMIPKCFDVMNFGRSFAPRALWYNIRVGVMEDVLRIKFSYPHYKNLLRATGDEELVEGNNWGDTFWGRCNGVGENQLGKLLMKIREEIK